MWTTREEHIGISTGDLGHLKNFMVSKVWMICIAQSYVIKSAPWTILWFRILGIFSGEYIKRLCVFMFKSCSNSKLLRRVLWISAEQTIGASLKHKNTQPLFIFNRENPKNSEPQNGLRRGLDFIALMNLKHIPFCFSGNLKQLEILN